MKHPNNTPGAVPAIPERYRAVQMMNGTTLKPNAVVFLAAEKHPERRQGEEQQWTATFADAVLVSGQRDPEHAACRALLDRGITGTVLFVHASTGTPGLSMDIEAGAGRSTTESDQGLRTIKYVPFDRQAHTSAAVRDLEAV